MSNRGVAREISVFFVNRIFAARLSGTTLVQEAYFDASIQLETHPTQFRPKYYHSTFKLFNLLENWMETFKNGQ